MRQRDRLLARDGRTLTIEQVTSRAARTTVYNFEADHNYYVSTAQLLVHNCPPLLEAEAGQGPLTTPPAGSSRC